MGSSKGGGGNPAAFTGGGPPAPPVQNSAPPSYTNFLPSGGGMATPESVSAAYAAAPSATPPMPVTQNVGPPTQQPGMNSRDMMLLGQLFGRDFLSALMARGR